MKKKNGLKNILQKTKGEAQDLSRGSVRGLYIDKIKALFKKAPRIIITMMLLILAILIYVFGLVECYVEGYKEPGILNILVEWFDGASLWLSLIAEIVILVFIYLWYSATHSGQIYDEKRQLTQSEYGTSGTAKQMSESEKNEAFDKGTFQTNTSNVIGSDLKTKHLLSVKRGYGINGNVIAYGSPGCGKSRCLVIPTLFNIIRRGESAIVTDPKGELYGLISEMARAHGYTVKIFNTNPDQMMHSDAVDFMKILGEDEFKIDAFVETIMLNISKNTEMDFWKTSQMNELKFVTTYVATNTVGIPKTLGGVYNFINSNSVDEIESIFFHLPDDHPAKPAFNTWSMGDSTVKGNTHAGLQIDLQRLSNKLIQKITGTDEIDFTLPGREKCLYFVSMNDQEDSMQWLIALFFTFLFKELVGYADKSKERTLPVKVTFVLDEFYNCGLIPAFDKKISQVRSRNIDVMMFLQALGQLQTMYPDNLWESIHDCCSTMMVIATRSLLTAKYFSEYSGIQTVITTNYRYEKLKGTEDSGSWVMAGTSEKDRALYNPDEIIRKDKDNILISTSTFNMTEVKKIDFSRHPMCKEIREVVAAEHKPDWVDHLTEKEKEMFKIDSVVYSKEGVLPIELCTDEDFLEEWTKEKEKKLKKKIAADRKKYCMSEDADSEDKDRLALAEDKEAEDTEPQKKQKKKKIKEKVVYETSFVKDGVTTTYERKDKTVSVEEHEQLQAEYEQEIDDSKIGRMFADED